MADEKIIDHRALIFADDITKDDPTARERLQNALLPYFAMGFTPVHTRVGKNYRCGLYALTISFNAAVQIVHRRRHAKVLTVTQLLEWLASDRFREACSTRIINEYESEGVEYNPEMIEERITELQRPSNLEQLALSTLLSIVNEEYRTNFQLAVITDGHQQEKNRTTCAAQLAEGYTIGPGPVLWIFNDNARTKAGKGDEDEPIMNHWEGFAPREWDREESASMHGKMVRGYGIDARRDADLENGVWILRAARAADKIEEPVNGLADLDIRVGSFLRDAPSPISEIPEGYRYMIASDGERGLVNTRRIGRIPTHAKAQGPVANQNGVKQVVADPVSPKPKKPKNWGVQKIRQACFQERRFRIFRTIAPTTKAGLKGDNNNLLPLPIGQGLVKDGDFLLDREDRQLPARALVTHLNGQTVNMHLRRLQVVERPWGLPDTLPVSNIEEIAGENTLDNLMELARARGILSIPKDITAPALRKGLEAWSQAHCTSLSLFRIKKDVYINQTYALRKDELVYKVPGAAATEASVVVRDFEGVEYDIHDGDLGREEENCWGLVLDSRVLNEIQQNKLATGHEAPRHRCNRPGEKQKPPEKRKAAAKDLQDAPRPKRPKRFPRGKSEVE